MPTPEQTKKKIADAQKIHGSTEKWWTCYCSMCAMEEGNDGLHQYKFFYTGTAKIPHKFCYYHRGELRRTQPGNLDEYAQSERSRMPRHARGQ
jgi:hypothetical protein